MNLYKSDIYLNDLASAISNTVEIERLFNSSILITGASGLIGSFLIDMLLSANKSMNANIIIYAMGRSEQRLYSRFEGVKTKNLVFVEHDVAFPLTYDFKADYIIHAASPAFPAAFNSNPVETIMSNIVGTKNLLDYGRKHGIKRLLYISSGEVYGQGDLTLDAFSEEYSGYVDPSSPRSCYPNAKRTSETMCVSYTKQYGLDTVIVRPSHTYGPTVTKEDNRANAQFVNNGLQGEDIILKSAGNQLRSYTYIADAASALFTVLVKGESGNAYNISNSESITTIAGFAKEVAVQTGTNVVFMIPDETDKRQMTPIVKQVLDSTKLEMLGWKGMFNLSNGINHTLAVMSNNIFD